MIKISTEVLLTNTTYQVLTLGVFHNTPIKVWFIPWASVIWMAQLLIKTRFGGNDFKFQQVFLTSSKHTFIMYIFLSGSRFNQLNNQTFFFVHQPRLVLQAESILIAKAHRRYNVTSLWATFNLKKKKKVNS